MAIQLGEKNRQAGQELDRIFMLRKQRESDTAKIEDSIHAHYQSIQKRINELEPGKLRAYNELMERQKDLQERINQGEARLHEVNSAIQQIEEGERGYSHRKEYASLEKQIAAARRNYESLSEEYDIIMMEPKEAHAKFVARVNEHKQNTKFMDSKVTALKEELKNLKQQLDDLSSTAVSQSTDDNGEAAKYELLVKRDQEMTAYVDKFPETHAGILADQEKAKSLIVGLLEHIGRGLDDATNLPDAGVMSEMEDAKAFKQRNLATAQKTMQTLQMERVKREKELEMLRSSEPKLVREITGLKESMAKMHVEMK
ncbi:IFT74, partial [Symbiodinium microadriaticum]